MSVHQLLFRPPASDRLPLAPMLGRLRRRTPLSEIEAQALLAMPHRLTRIDAGAYIVRDGEQANSCGVLLEGFVYRHKIVGSGARQILSIHLRGDIIDLQNSLFEYADHNVQALTHAQVALIPKQAILDLCVKYPGIAHALWVDTLVDASIFREWIVNVGRRNARQRIAHLLCEMTLRQEVAGLCEGASFAWPMTQEQLGDATGLTSVHVNRTLQGLRSDGLVSVGRRGVTVQNWPGLQEAGDFSPDYLHQGEA